MSQRLVLFAKRPRPGKVKTRLAAALGSRELLGLYRAFLADQLRLLEWFAATCQVELTLDGRWGEEDGDLPRFEGLRLSLQGPGDLGARMLFAFSGARKDGCDAAVVVGADSPTLPLGHVRRALNELGAGARCVIAPARDGGYVLIGLRRPEPALFDGIAWGGPQVFAETLRRAVRAGIEPVRLAPWYDVDDDAGLERLRLEMRTPAARRRAPHTARFLAALDSSSERVV